MNSFWLKIAGILVVIIAVIIGVKMLLPARQDQPKQPEKTFQDMVQKDKKDLKAQPSPADLTKEETENELQAQPIEPEKQVEFYFTRLDEIEKIQAERLLAIVPAGKSIGRLPAMGFELMVQSCRQIMSQWPGSIYDYKARRALSRIPRRYWSRYKITEDMLDLSIFTKQRPDTYQYQLEEGN